MNEVIDFSDLEKLYVGDNLLPRQIADIKGCHPATVRRYLRKQGIPLRREVIDWSDLKTLYVDKLMSTNEIAKLKGTQRRIVRRHLRQLGIPRRDRSQGQLASWKGDRRKIRNILLGKENPSWNGGKKHKGTNGYITVWCPEHPYSHHGRVYEHRLVVEKRIGRYLRPWEIVHHLDGIKDHNEDSNLELLASQTEHLPSILMLRTIHKLEEEVARLRCENKRRLDNADSFR
jgi:hypothetical protein